MFYIKSIEIQNEFTISRSCDVDIHTSLEVDGCSNDTSDCISIDLPQTWELGDDDTLYEELVDDIKVDILATPNELLAWLAEDAGMADSLTNQEKWWHLGERHGWLPEVHSQKVEALQELLTATQHDKDEAIADARKAWDFVDDLEIQKSALGQKMTEALAVRDQALAAVRAERDKALSELVDLRSDIEDKCYVGAGTTEAALQSQIQQLRDELKGRNWQIT